MLKNPRVAFVMQERWLHIIFWLSGAAFTVSVIHLCLQHPPFDPKLFPVLAPALLIFLGMLAGLGALSYFLLRFLQSRGYLTQTKLDGPRAILVEQAPGLALAFLFLIAYFSLAVTLGILPDDNFYDADSASWYNRLAAPVDQLIEMRPVHPFAFLIFRPLVWFVASFLSPFLHSSQYFAVLLVNAGAGALCVFLAWTFVKGWSGNGFFALLVAALLGLSTSHLILSAALETYMFSAAALITFLIVSQRPDPPLKTLVPAGLLTFGITLSNFFQTLILLALTDPRPVKIAKYTAAVLALSIALALVQVKIYATSQPFYDPAYLLAEDRYSYDILSEDLPRTLERAHVLARTISVFSIVAPRPLVLFEETGCEFPCFQTYIHRWNGALINSYAGFGSILARSWFVLLLLAGGLFLRRLFRSPRQVILPGTLLACIVFNFVLHMNYGDDPMLYSGDWTYALVFFIALTFKDLSEKTWFQFGMLAFIVMLMINNWQFLRAVLSTLSAHFS